MKGLAEGRTVNIWNIDNLLSVVRMSNDLDNLPLKKIVKFISTRPWDLAFGTLFPLDATCNDCSTQAELERPTGGTVLQYRL